MTALAAVDAAARRPQGRRNALLVLMVSAFLGFSALGTWQVERRAWKLALIERVEQRVRAPASVAPGPSEWPKVSRESDEYRHVAATGRFLSGADTLVQAVTDLGGGRWVLTPLLQHDGSLVLVNRGFIAGESARAPAASQVTVVGLLRLSEPGGGFLRKNDAAAGRWYSRDVQAIATARGLARVAPYFIDAEAAPPAAALAGDDSQPVGGLTVVSFHNSHLVYAITWYALAVLSLVGLWQVLRLERRTEGSGDVAAGRP